MKDYHHDFWLAVAAVGPLVALTIVGNINRYFAAAIRAEKKKAEKGSTRDDDLGRALHAQLLFNVVAWIGFGATTLATIGALLSLAWYRDFLGTHAGLILAVLAIVLAGATLPILGLIERALRNRLSTVGIDLKALRN